MFSQPIYERKAITEISLYTSLMILTVKFISKVLHDRKLRQNAQSLCWRNTIYRYQSFIFNRHVVVWTAAGFRFLWHLPNWKSSIYIRHNQTNWAEREFKIDARIKSAGHSKIVHLILFIASVKPCIYVMLAANTFIGSQIRKKTRWHLKLWIKKVYSLCVMFVIYLPLKALYHLVMVRFADCDAVHWMESTYTIKRKELLSKMSFSPFLICNNIQAKFLVDNFVTRNRWLLFI